MSSLYSVVMELRAEDDSIISATQGHHAYALFLNLIRQSNPGMADKLHTSVLNKPFTISSLQGKFQHVDKSLKTISGGKYFNRLTFLNEEVFCYFMDAVLKNNNRTLRLESAEFKLQQVLLNRRQSPRCNFQRYEELIDNACIERKIDLRFTSLTTFRSGGRRNILFPDPALVLGSYFNKWQYFSPLKLPDSLSTCWAKVLLATYKLDTHILHFNGYQEKGFEGKCRLELSGELSTDEVRAINILTDFAFYCGTGAKTTMGMGQTRRIYER